MQHTAKLADITGRFNLDLPERIPGFVNGSPIVPTATDAGLPHFCPATEERLYDVIDCTEAEVDVAVTAARRVADSSPWPRLSHAERKPVLRRIIDALAKHQDELAAIQALEVGFPLSGLQAMHMPRTLENFDFFIEVAGTLGGHTYTQTGRYLSMVTREPVGVAALVSPWNAPLVLASMKLAAALALGNSCVLKGSEYAPYSLYRFVEILHEADIPPGLVNLVNGRGPLTGKALVEHAGVDVIGFIGGSETGKAIMRSASVGLKKVGLELGGKSANIVLDSANLEAAVDGSLLAILSGNGEQCLAGSRILVQEGIADSFISEFVKRMSNIRVGDPFDDDTELGPIAFRHHFERMLSYSELALSEGKQILCGGKATAGFDKGYFFDPTAVEVTTNQSRLCQEEIFGPFVTIQRVGDIDHAIHIANESEYGLVSYVWSDDLPSVTKVSQQIKAGTVWVNTPLTRDLRAPFGGYKMSGIGRDGLHASVELMTEEKTVMYPNQPLVLPGLGQTDR